MYSFQAAKFPLFCTLAALLLFNKFNVDAQKFSLPGVTEDKFGNKSGSVDFEWTYTTPDLSKTNIYCGLSRSVVVQKKPGGVASIQQAFAGRADPIDVTTVSPNRIGYKLRNLDFSDANSYFCTMVYDSGSPEYSKTYNFKIYVRPVFANCLTDGLLTDPSGVSHFALREDGALNSTCYVYGNPVPTLDCTTYDIDNRIQASVRPTKNNGKSNFTSFPALDRMLFFNVKRAVTKVKCVADGGPTGTLSIERVVRVDYLPSAPIGITLVASTTNSIRITWKPPQQPGISRITDYFMELNHPNGTVTTTNYTVLSATPVLDHTFSNLFGNQKYTIYISAYNAVGKGARSVAASFTTVYYTSDPSTPTDSGLSTGSIVGIVFGVLCFIVLVMIIIFYVLKKRKEKARYPQTYVEEAVDYPPADGAMYAPVYKKKGNAPNDESTSGYPDIIHQANRNGEEKPMMRGDAPAGAGRQDAGYEKSRKEYV